MRLVRSGADVKRVLSILIVVYHATAIVPPPDPYAGIPWTDRTPDG